jgi:hypothetical protein
VLFVARDSQRSELVGSVALKKQNLASNKKQWAFKRKMELKPHPMCGYGAYVALWRRI